MNNLSLSTYLVINILEMMPWYIFVFLFIEYKENSMFSEKINAQIYEITNCILIPRSSRKENQFELYW